MTPNGADFFFFFFLESYVYHMQAVIGAGAAGLVAARELVREGHHVTVFEKGSGTGGVWVYTDDVESSDLLGKLRLVCATVGHDYDHVCVCYGCHCVTAGSMAPSDRIEPSCLIDACFIMSVHSAYAPRASETASASLAAGLVAFASCILSDVVYSLLVLTPQGL